MKVSKFSGGHLHLLQRLQLVGCDGAPVTFAHIEVLNWLRATGCEWDRWACSEAASAGHLEVLKCDGHVLVLQVAVI
jgi:hypothetical protein